MKNYYVLLGVQSDATMQQIRDAYRRLAKELHPDYYGHDSGPFIDLQEAYAVLSDPARRQAYDDTHSTSSITRQRSTGEKAEPLYPNNLQPEPLFPGPNPPDLGEYSLSRSFRTFSPSYDELFDRLWRNFGLAKPKNQRLRSLNVEIAISPEEALLGGRARILVPARVRCPDCHGRGGIGFYDCWHCEGYGFIQGEYPVTVTFPPGIINNYSVEIPLDTFGITNFFLRAIFRVTIKP